MEFETNAWVYDAITLPSITIETTGVLLLVILPAAAVIGFFSGSHRRKQLLAANREIDMVVGETTLTAILALLGLLLAFTFSNALNTLQDSKSALIDESAALGTAFLRADYLPEPGRTDLQKALLAYAKTRYAPGDGTITTLDEAKLFLDVSLRAQAKLWPLTLEATADPVPPAMKSFVAGAVNEVIDAHLYRMQTMSLPVSEVTQIMLLGAALTALFLLGNRAGMLGRSLTWRTFVFSGFLIIVMFTIIDTQRTGDGAIVLDESSLLATIFDMEVALADRM